MDERNRVRAKVRCTLEMEIVCVGEGIDRAELVNAISAHAALMDVGDFLGAPGMQERVEVVAVSPIGDAEVLSRTTLLTFREVASA